jgi:hypothetical protein
MAPDLQTRLTQGMTFAQLLERSRHASLLLGFLEAAPPEPLPEEVAWVLALVEVQTADKKSFRSLPSRKSTRLAKRLSERPRL